MISTSVRRYMLGVLVVVYTFNFIDRQILSILLQDIKQDLALSDTQLGLLSGFAFAAFYVTMGIPIARWADLHNRRNLISVALALWSGMTALSGLALNFWHLLVARIGVGVGEAGCSPPAHSIIADLYAPEVRSTALGVYSLGIPFGILFGFLAGGWINEFFGWRVAFFVVGLPGLALALIVRLTVPEPPRGYSEQSIALTDAPDFAAVFRVLSQKKSFIHLAIGGGMTAFVGYAWVTWLPAYLIRSHAMSTGDVGTWLGFIIGIAGGLGIWLGGYLADRLGARDVRWRLWIVTLGLLCVVPFGAGVFLSPTPQASLLWLIPPMILGNFYQATSFAQTQSMVELRMRAIAAAVLLFVINVIGLGGGPQFVGILSDALSARYGDESLRWALLICSLVNIWAAWHYWLAGRALPQDLLTSGAASEQSTPVRTDNA